MHVKHFDDMSTHVLHGYEHGLHFSLLKAKYPDEQLLTHTLIWNNIPV